ncbi:MAG TPA: hypothetical protein VGD87_18055, partial [Archangium sp.]
MKLRRLLPLLLLSGCTGNLAGPPAPCATKDGAEVLATRCLTCHSVTLTGTARSGATAGVDFDTEADVRRWVDRIRQRTFVDKTMPPGLPLAECESTQLDAHLTALATGTCTPSCSGRACGSDGCGGQCGSCAPTENCDAAGQCSPAVSCSPDCTGRSCGDDGCGGSCGT